MYIFMNLNSVKGSKRGKKFVEVVYKFIFKCAESPVLLDFHIVSKPVTLFGGDDGS